MSVNRLPDYLAHIRSAAEGDTVRVDLPDLLQALRQLDPSDASDPGLAP